MIDPVFDFCIKRGAFAGVRSLQVTAFRIRPLLFLLLLLILLLFFFFFFYHNNFRLDR